MAELGRRRYAVVGTGHRSQMYIDAMLGDQAEVAEIVAWCEPNPGRMDYYDGVVREALGADATLPARYTPDQLEDMIKRERIDRVIVTSPDYTHAEMVSRALLAGADVVVEKPLTINAAGVQRIGKARKDSGRELVMTFNYRYSPRNSALRQVVASGAIGKVTQVHFEWALDTVHGADYFRRWHRLRECTNGLLIHKSSHHFDLVNWWIADRPETVFANGALAFYGDKAAAERGLGARPERGTGHREDPFCLDLTDDPRLKALYLDAEQYDGYLRDQDVFGPGITIEDTMSVSVKYAGGPLLSYSLNAYSPWEGYRVSIMGTHGRAELDVVERGAVIVAEDGSVVLDPSALADDTHDEIRPTAERLVLQQHWGRAQEVEIVEGEGAHGGGDAIMLDDVFRGPSDDPLGRPAGYEDGVAAVSVGIAARESMETGQAISIPELHLLD